jgi:hypothetical protein
MYIKIYLEENSSLKKHFEKTYQRDDETFEDAVNRMIDFYSTPLEPPQFCTLSEIAWPCDKE